MMNPELFFWLQIPLLGVGLILADLAYRWDPATRAAKVAVFLWWFTASAAVNQLWGTPGLLLPVAGLAWAGMGASPFILRKWGPDRTLSVDSQPNLEQA